MAASNDPNEMPVDLDEKVVIVSCDTHIGPRVREDLRQYCEKKYLEDFDAFVKYLDDKNIGGVDALRLTTGHHDVHRRLKDLDQDGVAAEVIFHGSQNGEPVPFNVSDASLGPGSIQRKYDVDYELAGVGRRIYNRWLADFCSVEPERHVGLAQLPMWDIDAAIEEATWAKEHGLKGINFPSESGPTELSQFRRGGLYYYHDPKWEPFWSACEDLDMQLASHGGAGDMMDPSLPASGALWVYESQEIQRRPMQRMIFAGVFERHPDLKLVFTEHPGDWWRTKLADMDSISYMAGLEKPASHYAKRNVFIGASFQARFEAIDAVEHDYWQNIIWGNDYPHVEGTWTYKEDPNETPSSQLSLRYTYSGLDPMKVRAMLGLNGVRVYGLDHDYLRKVADNINAPTLREALTPIDAIPDKHGMWAFRQKAAFA
jgi:predicted TIM-barrel fold metal-dependent hydrolase